MVVERTNLEEEHVWVLADQVIEYPFAIGALNRPIPAISALILDHDSSRGRTGTRKRGEDFRANTPATQGNSPAQLRMNRQGDVLGPVLVSVYLAHSVLSNTEVRQDYDGLCGSARPRTLGIRANANLSVILDHRNGLASLVFRYQVAHCRLPLQ